MLSWFLSPAITVNIPTAQCLKCDGFNQRVDTVETFTRALHYNFDSNKVLCDRPLSQPGVPSETKILQRLCEQHPSLKNNMYNPE